MVARTYNPCTPEICYGYINYLDLIIAHDKQTLHKYHEYIQSHNHFYKLKLIFF